MFGWLRRLLGQRSTSTVPGPSETPAGDAWVIDCETTGLSAYDRLVSFAAVEMAGPKRTGRYVYLVFNPGRPSHPKAAMVHGFGDQFLSMQPRFVDHAELVSERLSDHLIVAHNAEFDCSFINR